MPLVTLVGGARPPVKKRGKKKKEGRKRKKEERKGKREEKEGEGEGWGKR